MDSNFQNIVTNLHQCNSTGEAMVTRATDQERGFLLVHRDADT